MITLSGFCCNLVSLTKKIKRLNFETFHSPLANRQVLLPTDSLNIAAAVNLRVRETANRRVIASVDWCVAISVVFVTVRLPLLFRLDGCFCNRWFWTTTGYFLTVFKKNPVIKLKDAIVFTLQGHQLHKKYTHMEIIFSMSTRSLGALAKSRALIRSRSLRTPLPESDKFTEVHYNYK